MAGWGGFIHKAVFFDRASACLGSIYPPDCPKGKVVMAALHHKVIVMAFSAGLPKALKPAT